MASKRNGVCNPGVVKMVFTPLAMGYPFATAQTAIKQKVSMTRFTDAALLKGDYSHMAQEFRAGERAAPRRKDWRGVAADSPAELAAQDVARQIFELQKQLDEAGEEASHKIDVTHLTAVGPMRVLGLVPGEGDVLRLDGMLPSGEPVAQSLHVAQLALTFSKSPLHEDTEEDDGLEIGFLIFDQLKKRKKKKTRQKRRLSLSTSRTVRDWGQEK